MGFAASGRRLSLLAALADADWSRALAATGAAGERAAASFPRFRSAPTRHICRRGTLRLRTRALQPSPTGNRRRAGPTDFLPRTGIG